MKRRNVGDETRYNSFCEAKKLLLWGHGQEGRIFNEITRFFDNGHSIIERIISREGGVRPHKRERSRFSLALSEREEISRGLAAKMSMRAIARLLQRHLSSISREVARNSGINNYLALTIG